MKSGDIGTEPLPIKITCLLGALLSAVCALLICAEIVARTFFSVTIPGTVELVANAVVIITFLHLPHALHDNSLLRITFLSSRLGDSYSHRINKIGFLLGALLFALIIFSSFEKFLEAYVTGEYEGSDYFRLLVWPIRAIVILLWSVCFFYCLINVFSNTASNTEDSSS